MTEKPGASWSWPPLEVRGGHSFLMSPNGATDTCISTALNLWVYMYECRGSDGLFISMRPSRSCSSRLPASITVTRNDVCDTTREEGSRRNQCGGSLIIRRWHMDAHAHIFLHTDGAVWLGAGAEFADGMKWTCIQTVSESECTYIQSDLTAGQRASDFLGLPLSEPPHFS